jgi:Fic family protein
MPWVTLISISEDFEMSIISAPPPRVPNTWQVIIEKHKDHVGAYVGIAHPIDSKGRYLHYDQLRFRLPKGIDHALAWSVIKFARTQQHSSSILLGEPLKKCDFLYTPAMHLAMSACDQNTTTAALEWMCAKIGEGKHLQYLLKDLIEDEAISSSQLEGSATTTKAAKDLLKRKKGPRSVDEKMILGNFKMMKRAWDKREDELSLDLIRDLHRIGVEGIEDNRYHPGEFKDNDDVVVENSEGDVVHQPPPVENLEGRLEKICAWVNQNHTDVLGKDYMHPLVKAIILHFIIGFEHPFHDGNGRVARSLFYWFMFKKGFGAFRYIAISTLLKTAPIKYGKSYLYVETDDMDLTYFLDYQCRIIVRAISKFKSTYEETVKSIDEFNAFLYSSGLYPKLTEKQKIVFNVAKSGVASDFTITNVKENLGCAYNTAASVLNGLVDLNLFEKTKKNGNEWIYSMRDNSKIMKDWIK